MSVSHDRASGSHAEASEITGLGVPDREPAVPPAGADPLSDVLQTVRLTGALFFVAEATSPWCVAVPQADEFAAILLPRARHIVSYHVVVEGSGFASVPGQAPVAFGPGDIIVFPQGDAYRMECAPGTPPELDAAQTLLFFRDMAAGRLPFVVPEGGGGDPPARFLCGFLGCDARPFNPLLAALPRLLRVARPSPGDAGDDLLDRLVALTLAEARADRAGGESIRLRLSELLFVELLRRHLAALPAGNGGWLAGLRDPVAGRALALLHARPAEPWTLELLAAEAGVSRSVLAERFAARVGQAPMQYLMQWRMQLAARLLGEGDAKVAAVAEAVGYASEAAFSRGFKKIAGVPPSAWRRGAGPTG